MLCAQSIYGMKYCVGRQITDADIKAIRMTQGVTKKGTDREIIISTKTSR